MNPAHKPKWIIVARDDQGEIEGWRSGEEWLGSLEAAEYDSKQAAQQVADELGTHKDIDILVARKKA